MANTTRPDPTHAYTAAELATSATCRPGNSIFTEARGFENYRQPYMDQVTLGLERSLSPRLKAEVLYITRVNKSILALVDHNAAMNWKPLHDVYRV